MSQLRTVQEEELEEVYEFDKQYVGSQESFDEFRQRFDKWPETFVIYVEDDEILADATGKMETEVKMGLQSIGVREGYKGEGIGSKILKFFEKKAAKYADVITVASASNIEGFYRANGYEPVQIMLQVEKSELPKNYQENPKIVGEKDIDEDTKFLYASFDEYSKKIRDEMKEKFSAFEVNTIYEKNISEEARIQSK